MLAFNTIFAANWKSFPYLKSSFSCHSSCKSFTPWKNPFSPSAPVFANLHAYRHLLISRPTESVALECFLVEMCEKSTHMAIMVRRMMVMMMIKSGTHSSIIESLVFTSLPFRLVSYTIQSIFWIVQTSAEQMPGHCLFWYHNNDNNYWTRYHFTPWSNSSSIIIIHVIECWHVDT